MPGRGRGGGAGGGRGGGKVGFAKPADPSFIRALKQQYGFKEGPSLGSINILPKLSEYTCCIKKKHTICRM